MDFLAEIFLQRRNVVGEAAEDDAEGFGKPKLARTVLLHAERGGHAALAPDAVLEGDFLKVALPVIAPSMIDAGEGLGVAAALQRDQGAAMRAAVFEGIELAIGISGDDDRRVADERRDEIAGVFHLDREAEIVPARPLEDAPLLGGVDLAVLKHPERHAGDAVARPDMAIGFAGRARDLIQHVTSRWRIAPSSSIAIDRHDVLFEYRTSVQARITLNKVAVNMTSGASEAKAVR